MPLQVVRVENAIEWFLDGSQDDALPRNERCRRAWSLERRFAARDPIPNLRLEECAPSRSDFREWKILKN